MRALCLLLVAGWLSLPSPARAAASDNAASLVAEAADVAADAEQRADASPDPDTGSFFDTFMAFLDSSALHRQQPSDEEAADASEAQTQQPEGRGLGFLAEAPIQDGGQADRVKRTGQIPAQILSGVINKKLGYLGAKTSHHVHFHNYGAKCDKPHFSLWEFKKAILHKLLEAAKAIGGGVLAIKGKLLTAKGHLVAAKGRKLATKGVELTEFGKSVLTKALGYGGHDDEVHAAPSAPSAPSAPAAPYAAPVYGAPAFAGYQYAAPAAQHAQHAQHQYLPPQHAPSGHGYNAAVSLLNEYSRSGFGNPLPVPATHAHTPQAAHAAHAAHAHHGAQHRTGTVGTAQAGPSTTGSAGTLPGNLQAGLLVLQPAPYSLHGSASSQHVAALPAPALGLVVPAASAIAVAAARPPSDTVAVYTSEGSAPRSAAPSRPLVLAPGVTDAVSTPETNKVRRYAAQPAPPLGSRRSLDVAMASVVRRLQGADLLEHPDARDAVRAAVTRLVAA